MGRVFRNAGPAAIADGSAWTRQNLPEPADLCLRLPVRQEDPDYV